MLLNKIYWGEILLSIKYIIIPFVIAVLSQFIKVLIEFIKHKKISISRFVDGMGGMPSTHSALVSSVSTMIFFECGMSPLFAVTLFFSLIVIYDSMGIRYESGKQAEIINEISGSNLEEKIGHKPIETLVGTILGVVFTLFIYNIL